MITAIVGVVAFLFGTYVGNRASRQYWIKMAASVLAKQSFKEKKKYD